jgi:hypothetical protein
MTKRLCDDGMGMVKGASLRLEAELWQTGDVRDTTASVVVAAGTWAVGQRICRHSLNTLARKTRGTASQWTARAVAMLLLFGRCDKEVQQRLL